MSSTASATCTVDFDASIVRVPGLARPRVRLLFVWPEEVLASSRLAAHARLDWRDAELVLHLERHRLVFALPAGSCIRHELVQALRETPCLLLQGNDAAGKPVLGIEFSAAAAT